jgi:beta-galactosidase
MIIRFSCQFRICCRRYYLYKSQWSAEKFVHLLPHWNWIESQEIPVIVYTNLARVELFLNNRSLGRQTMAVDLTVLPVEFNRYAATTYASPYRLCWRVPFERGELRAEATSDDDDDVIAVDVRRTADAPHRIVLTPDRHQLDDETPCFVTVRIEDANRTLCPHAALVLRFVVSAGGTIVGVDNGDAASAASLRVSHRTTFGGLALLVVRRSSPSSLNASLSSSHVLVSAFVDDASVAMAFPRATLRLSLN